MSIASAPEDDGAVEFYIRWVAKPESENPLTHLLWTLKDGDRLYMRAVAAGVFTVKDTVGVDDNRLRVMVAAGTGSAPVGSRSSSPRATASPSSSAGAAWSRAGSRPRPPRSSSAASRERSPTRSPT